MAKVHGSPLIEAPVFLLGMPRSGTTWLSQIFESAPDVAVRLSPNYSYDLKDSLSVASSKEDWIRVLSLALQSEDPFMTQNWKREREELEWIEKDPSNVKRLAIKDTRFHEVYCAGMVQFPTAKSLYIVRNPCGCLSSWRNSKEFPRGADFREQWRTGACRKSEGPGEYWGFDDWKALTGNFLKLEQEEPNRFKVFRYEDLVADPVGVARMLFNFVGLKLHSNVISFLSRSHAVHDPNVYSVFRSPKVADRWRTSFPKDIKRKIYTELRNTEYERFIR